MNRSLLTGAAFAAALALPLSASAVAAPSSSLMASDTPHWTAAGRLSDGGRALQDVLRHSALDGFAVGAEVARRVDALIATGQTDDANALLSRAWVEYVQTLERRAPGMEYADASAAPRPRSGREILSAAASTPSLAGLVKRVSAVNPVYAGLRQAAIDSGRVEDPGVAADLARLRTVSSAERYIIVDAASANLWMVEDGRIAGTMRVITGDEANATPMIASVIREATFNPYWNVPGDFVRDTIAPRIVEQGIAYLQERQYEVFESDFTDAPRVDPAQVDWAAVAAGTAKVRLRRAPGEWNSMGKVKIGFANDHDIYLHDTPDKSLFAKADRNLSHGCIRLSDAPRLAQWLFGRPVGPSGDAAEQKLSLPAGVPIFITRTAQVTVEGVQLALRDSLSTGGDIGLGRTSVGR